MALVALCRRLRGKQQPKTVAHLSLGTDIQRQSGLARLKKSGQEKLRVDPSPRSTAGTEVVETCSFAVRMLLPPRKKLVWKKMRLWAGGIAQGPIIPVLRVAR